MIIDLNPLRVQSMQMRVEIGCHIAPVLSGYNSSRDCALRKALTKEILYRLPCTDLWLPQAHGPPMSEVNKIVEETMYDYCSFDYLHP